MNWIRKIILIGLLALVSLPFGAVSAHRPGWGEDGKVTEIEDIEVSYAFYRSLNASPAQAGSPIAVTGGAGLAAEAAAQAGTVDIYAFEGRAGQNLYTGINIPVIEGLEDYAVTLAIVGPGLDPAGLAQLPIEAPDESLGAVLLPSRVSGDFFEPFTQTRYWGRQETNLRLPSSGTYYLLVWNPENRPGKYVLATGTAEVFGPADLFRFPVWWVQVHLFFEHGPALALAGAALLFLIVAGVALRKRRQYRTA